MYRFVVLLLLWSCALCSNAWNTMGHQLIAQIAYDNLTPEAKKLCNKYNKSMNKSNGGGSFVVASAWLDVIKKRDVHMYDTFHYIDIPYTTEDLPLPPVPEINALTAIKQAILVLKSSKSTSADKGLSLRILTHVVGDVHQPLHTVARVSSKYPNGDSGGNLFPLATNPIGINLHQYWDNGGGVLIGQANSFQVKNKAKQLEEKWSCKQASLLKKPEEWIHLSNQIAKNSVYVLSVNSIPSKRYQLNAQNITNQQIAMAGCRLAALLNDAVKA